MHVGMRYIFGGLLSILLLTPVTSRAEEEFLEMESGGGEPDHLVPVRPRDDGQIDRLRTESRPIARFEVFPSFSSPYCVSVCEAPVGHQYSLLVTSTSKFNSSGYYKDSNNATETPDFATPVIEVRRTISKSLAAAIQRAWAQTILKTRYPDHSSQGLDGAIYYFSTFILGYGDIEGQTWSPRSGATAKMVELGGAMLHLALNEEEKEEPLIERFKELEKLGADVVPQAAVTLRGSGLKRTGKISLKPGATLSSAIAQAGGFTDLADIRRVSMTRSGVSSRHNLKKENADAIVLQDGDLIEVLEVAGY